MTDAVPTGRVYGPLTTANVCEPSLVRTVLPLLIVALCVPGLNDDSTTFPEANVAAKRVMPKSCTQLSASLPILVASRVIVSTWRIRYCSQSPTEAEASRMARVTEPTVRSIRLEHAPCTVEAMLSTSVEKFCRESCI